MDEKQVVNMITAIKYIRGNKYLNSVRCIFGRTWRILTPQEYIFYLFFLSLTKSTVEQHACYNSQMLQLGEQRIKSRRNNTACAHTLFSSRSWSLMSSTWRNCSNLSLCCWNVCCVSGLHCLDSTSTRKASYSTLTTHQCQHHQPLGCKDNNK